jgi:hypothetical protein
MARSATSGSPNHDGRVAIREEEDAVVVAAARPHELEQPGQVGAVQREPLDLFFGARLIVEEPIAQPPELLQRTLARALEAVDGDRPSVDVPGGSALAQVT